jgi:transcriptional regulator with XRE-family HTH domain
MTTSLQRRIASEIRAELARQRKSQADLARALGRSEAYTTRRLGERDPVAWDTAELELIANYLDVPVSQFLTTSESAA